MKSLRLLLGNSTHNAAAVLSRAISTSKMVQIKVSQ